ncbi:MAG: hypothetical protein M2R45_00060 [Verrucomicrobia subdivision 3 bacterium]|nr:hypothetical protein [Limisphaerales bacterium]MCS1412481.1 hypothetical protein [Limisphaerales bacterium]
MKKTAFSCYQDSAHASFCFAWKYGGGFIRDFLSFRRGGKTAVTKENSPGKLGRPAGTHGFNLSGKTYYYDPETAMPAHGQNLA